MLQFTLRRRPKKGGVLSFRIYGEETRESGREISFESEDPRDDPTGR